MNPTLSNPATGPLPEGWQWIHQPAARPALAISILAGLGLPFIPFVILTVQSWLRGPLGASSDESIPWWTVIPVVLVSVVLHEGLHLLGHPGWGCSPRSLLMLWPRRLGLGVFYDGFMSRGRWLIMRLAPLIGLAALPTLLLLATDPYQMNFFLRQFMVMVILVNCVGAGGDLAAAVIVAGQVPPGGEIGIWNGRACWRKKMQSMND